MKKQTHKLLEKMHKINTEVAGTDVAKYLKEQAKIKIRKLINKIKEIDLEIYKIINRDDNHKRK